MRYESILLDIDGTLWDSRALVAEGYNLQLIEEGLDRYCVDAEQLRLLFGKVMTAIADVIFPDLPKSDRYALMERCMDRENRYLAENPCQIGYPGIQEVLSELAKNHRLFIVSNSQQGYPDLCIEKLGIGSVITGHLCFGDTGTSKGQTILTLMQKYGIASCVYVGDTKGDQEACLEAGVPFIWCEYGFDHLASGFQEKLSSPADLLILEKEGKL